MVDVEGKSQSSLIQVRDLDKTYRRGGEEIHVLQGLNLDVNQGEFVAFMGPSGSGKTTLLNLLGGLDVPTRGSITVAGDEITHMSSGKLTEWRARHVGFIFQIYNLIPVLNAFQNVELPLLLTKLSKAERRSHVETALAVVGLADRMKHFPRQLSGGQEQRVAIARAIVADPTFLLCDEPTGDLDRKSADEVMNLIAELVGNGPIPLFTWKREFSSKAAWHRGPQRAPARWGGRRKPARVGGSREIQQPDFSEPISQENPAGAHHRLFCGGPFSIRLPGRRARCLQPRRGRGRRRSSRHH
jgi:putative ABC transport system ATP-binding protein